MNESLDNQLDESLDNQLDESLENQSEIDTSASRSHAPREKKSRTDSAIEILQKGRNKRHAEKMEIMKSLASTSKISQPADDVDLFMQSLAISVKKFPKRIIIEAKAKLMQVVCDLQNKCLDEEPEIPHLPTYVDDNNDLYYDYEYISS